MNAQSTFILAAIVVSWVMFVFNFVLGYYIGRAVEAGDKAKAKNHKKGSSSWSSYLPSRQIYPSLSN